MLGPSGSGKTTTLRLIAGFEKPDDGRVELDGTDVVREPPYERNVNTVFQDYALFPHMTIVENVAYGLRVKGIRKAERRERVDEMLERMRLPDVGDRKPSQLSGGQRQRVGAGARHRQPAGGAVAGRAAGRARSQAPAGDASPSSSASSRNSASPSSMSPTTRTKR